MALVLGTKLGPYEVVGPLGAGGMGEEYVARDSRLRRELAIKVLANEIARDPERLRRFEKEARLASANIITVYDIGCCGKELRHRGNMKAHCGRVGNL